MSVERRILLNPGPATTTDSVKLAQVVSDICPREREFVAVIAQVRQDLLWALGDEKEYACVLMAGSGTAGVEASLVSAVPHDGKVLIVNNGVYGDRLVEIARAHALAFSECRSPWDCQLEVSLVEEHLKRDPAVSHIAIVQHETSTGMLNPLESIGALAGRYGCSVIVDAVSSFAGVPIPLGNHPLDILVSTSNKCVQGMAGLTFLFCRKQALHKMERRAPRAYYLDVVAQHRVFESTGEMRFTPPVQVVYALRQALAELRQEGVENRIARYRGNWDVLRAGLSKLGFRFLLPEALQSKILTAVLEPGHPSFSFETLHDHLLKKGFTIYPGKVPATKTFRIANMGAIDQDDIRAFLSALSSILSECGMKVS